MKILAVAGDKRGEMKKTTKTLTLVALILSSFALASCSKDTTVPEATLTMAKPDLETTAKSADGLFELTIPAGAFAAEKEIKITTRRDLTPQKTISLVYEVGPAGIIFDVPARATAKVPATAEGFGFTLVNGMNPAVADPINGAVFDAGNREVRGTVTNLSLPYFTVANSSYDACALRQCGQSCSVCAAGDTSCTSPEGAFTCDDGGACVRGVAQCLPPDGWDDPIGSGKAFIVNSFAIADAQPGNRTAPFGAFINDQLRQGLLGGEMLRLIELTALDDPYLGDDDSLTLRTFRAKDFDDPYFPANNFQVPAGHTVCCEFLVEDPAFGVGAANLNRTRGQVVNHRLETVAGVDSFTLTQPLGENFPLTDARIIATLPAAANELLEGRIEGTFTFATLASASNPFCRTVSPECTVQFLESSLLDLFTTLIGLTADVDRDGDGLETVLDMDGDARIDRCLNGDGMIIPPTDQSRPDSCVLDTRMADGFSVVVDFTAVAAKIRGFAEGDNYWSQTFLSREGILVSKITPRFVGAATHARVTSGSTIHFFERRVDGTFVIHRPYTQPNERIDLAFYDTLADPNPFTVEPLTAPQLPYEYLRYVCCASAGICQTDQAYAEEQACPQDALSTVCASNLECESLSDLSTAPDASDVSVDAISEGIVEVRMQGGTGGELFILEVQRAPEFGASVGFDFFPENASVGASVRLEANSGERLYVSTRAPDGKVSRTLQVVVP